MASVSSLLSEDQFLCPICLDVFTDPVTIPCGHNFCKSCITEHWDTDDKHQCPLCKEQYEKIPHLRVNTFISEMAAQLKQSVLRETTTTTSSSSEEQHTDPGEVLCDFCTDTKQRALKSCLDCLISYCKPHLEPHRRLPALKRHKLINPVDNLESRVCKKHQRPLEHFCRTDQICVCRFCSESEHKLHHIVPLKEEYEVKKAELGKTEAEVQRMIHVRQLKIEQIKQSMRPSDEDADRETATSVEVFTTLVKDVERSLAQLLDFLEEKHKTTKKEAESFVKELEEEIYELRRRSSELEQLSHNEDPLQFLQSFVSRNPDPPIKAWAKVKVYSSLESRKVLMAALAQLEETLANEVKKMCPYVELKMAQHFAVDVTLNPETAHSALVLSDDGKQVCHEDVELNISGSPQRSLKNFFVLGNQSFSSGSFYFEVQVEGKTNWILGVAEESNDRKGRFTLSQENGLWALVLNNGKVLEAYADSPTPLHLKSKPQKVGVFVDYEEGLVSFYDVRAPAHIHSFTGCNFTKKLLPIFNPMHNCGGKNSAPLIICPVNRTD